MKILGKLKSKQIVFDRTCSHTVSHSEVLKFLPECFEQIKIKNIGNFYKSIIAFKNPVGLSFLIKTNRNDTILFAKRPPRNHLSRFALNKKSQIDNHITLYLSNFDEDTNKYLDGTKYAILLTAYIGKPTPREPTDSYFNIINDNNLKEYKKSVNFWNTHALVFGKKIIDIQSITYTKPWK